MSDKQDFDEDQEMQSLFAHAQERLQPSPELLERAKQAARPEWQAAVARARAGDNATRPDTRPGLQTWAMAAAILLATVLVGWQTLSKDEFEIQVLHADGLRLNNEALSTGKTRLQVDDEIYTRSLAELAVSGAHSFAGSGTKGNSIDLRLAANTRARWLSPDRLQLLSGGVFVDTHGSARFGVVTSAGQINDIGTRYIATLNGEVLEVAVSEGEIEVTTASSTVRATPLDSGSAAVLTVAGQSIERSDEAADSSRWHWAMEHRQEYKGMLIADALTAVTKRLGKGLQFQSSGDTALARSYVVQGETAGLSAVEALQSIAATNNIEVIEDTKTISVSFRRR